MHTSVVLTDKRRTHAQSNYTNTKPEPRKWNGPILHPWTHPHRGSVDGLQGDHSRDTLKFRHFPGNSLTTCGTHAHVKWYS